MTLNMNWHIIVSDTAKKNLSRIPANDSQRIEIVVEDMKYGPFRGDIAKLDADENRWRRRMGSYRILFKILSDKRIVFVYDIIRRTSKTYANH